MVPEDYHRLGCDAELFGRNSLTFRRNVLPSSSEWKNTPSKQPAKSKRQAEGQTGEAAVTFFGRYSDRISVGTLTLRTQVLRNYPRFLRVNTRRVSRLGPLPDPFISPLTLLFGATDNAVKLTHREIPNPAIRHFKEFGSSQVYIGPTTWNREFEGLCASFVCKSWSGSMTIVGTSYGEKMC
jgi:hypothetical protein